jgi:hypothetical protein
MRGDDGDAVVQPVGADIPVLCGTAALVNALIAAEEHVPAGTGFTQLRVPAGTLDPADRITGTDGGSRTYSISGMRAAA